MQQNGLLSNLGGFIYFYKKVLEAKNYNCAHEKIRTSTT